MEYTITSWKQLEEKIIHESDVLIVLSEEVALDCLTSKLSTTSQQPLPAFTNLQTVQTSTKDGTSGDVVMSIWREEGVERKKVWMSVLSKQWDVLNLRTLPYFKKQIYETMMKYISYDTMQKVVVLVEEENSWLSVVLVCLAIFSHPKLAFVTHSNLENHVNIETNICHSDTSITFQAIVHSLDEQRAMLLTGEVLEAAVEQVLHTFQAQLQQAVPSMNLPTISILFMRRLLFAMYKDRTKPRGIQNMRHQLLHQLASKSSHEIDQEMAFKRPRVDVTTETSLSTTHEIQSVKPLPSFEAGLKVFEFFSGIG